MKPGHSTTQAAGLLVALLAIPALGGCTLEAAMAGCADCGEVRSISPRQLRSEIRLLTDAPQTVALLDSVAAPIVYDVRVRMDRGGSRDFVLSDAAQLRVGARVEIRAGRVVPLATGRDHWS